MPFKMPSIGRRSPQINMPSMRGFMDPYNKSLERTGDIVGNALGQYIQAERSRRQKVDDIQAIEDSLGMKPGTIHPKSSDNKIQMLFQKESQKQQAEAMRQQQLGDMMEGRQYRKGIASQNRTQELEDTLSKQAHQGSVDAVKHERAKELKRMGLDAKRKEGNKPLSPSQQINKLALDASGKMQQGIELSPQETMSFQKVFSRDPLALARSIKEFERRTARDAFEPFTPKSDEEYINMAKRQLEAVNPRPEPQSGMNLMQMMQGQGQSDPLGIR